MPSSQSVLLIFAVVIFWKWIDAYCWIGFWASNCFVNPLGGSETVYLGLITMPAPSAYAVRVPTRFSHPFRVELAEGAIWDSVLGAGSSKFESLA